MSCNSIHIFYYYFKNNRKNRIKQETMFPKSKIEVLSGLRWILKVTNLYNKNGVRFKYNKNGDSIELPDAFVFCVIAFPTFYLGLLTMWLVIEKNFDLKLISTCLTGTIALSVVTSSYVSLTTKTDLVISTIDPCE